MVAKADLLFGKIAVKNRLLTQEQVEDCLRLQEQFGAAGMQMGVGEICRRKNLLTDQQVIQILQAQRFLEIRKEDTRFGDVAMRNGLLSTAHLEECLDYQKECFKKQRDLFRLGEICRERGYLTDQEVAAVLKAQKRSAEGGPDVEDLPDDSGPVGDTVRIVRETEPSSDGNVAEGDAGTSRQGFEPLCLETLTVEHRVYDDNDRRVDLLAMDGALDAHTFPDFQGLVDRLLEDEGTRIVVDCARLSYISSAGIGVFIGCLHEVRERDGDLRLANLTEAVRDVIELIGADLFAAFPGVEEARRSFAG